MEMTRILFESSQTISILCIFMCFYFPVSLFFPLFLFGIWLMFYDIFLFIVISFFFLCVVSLVYLADYSTPWDPLPLLSFTPYYSPFSTPPLPTQNFGIYPFSLIFHIGREGVNCIYYNIFQYFKMVCRSYRLESSKVNIYFFELS